MEGRNVFWQGKILYDVLETYVRVSFANFEHTHLVLPNVVVSILPPNQNTCQT